MVYAGDIAAAVGLKDTYTGDTLCDAEHPIILESMTFPEPVIEVDRAQDQGRPGQAGARPAASGRGGPDLPRQDRPRDRRDAHRRHGRAAPRGARRPHDPRVQGRGQHRQAAGRLSRDDPARRRGQRPLHPPDRRQGPVRPRGHQAGARREGRPASSSSTRSSAARSRASTSSRSSRASARRSPAGIYAGYPVVDIKVTLFDGSYHDVDSSEMAFKIAGSMAFKDAFAKADPAILEPIMKVEVVDARGVHGRRHRRPQQPPRPDRGDGVARHDPGRPGVRPARRRCSATSPTCAA